MTVLLRGRLRVDAQRAASKLRDHLLADPSTWLCEVVRSASMSSATQVNVEYDSDDVWVTFDGAAWPESFLETAASDLGVADDRRESALDRRLRLFTLAMYAALGDEAEAVEVFVRDPSGAIIPARVEAAGLADPSKPRAEPRPVPKASRAVSAITAHVERPTSLRTLKRFVTSAAPPEVTRLRERWSTRSVPVHVNGVALVDTTPTATWSFDVPGSSLLRLEYRPLAEEMAVHFHEHGILVAVERASLPNGLPIRLPFILLSEAAAVPSNISRSRVQAAHVRAVVDRALASLADAVRILTFERANAKEATRRDELHELVGRLAWAVATRPELMSSSLAFLLEVPLLLDVWGASHSLASLFELHKSTAPIYFCRGERVIAAEVRVLVAHVFRAGPFSLDRLAFATDARPFEEVEADVALGLRRRAHTLARPAAAFELPHDPRHYLRAGVELHGTAALFGLRAFDGGGLSATIHFYVDGHVIETATLPLPQGGLPFDALVAAPSRLPLNVRYDGLARTQAFDGFVLDLMTAATKLLLQRKDEVAPDRLSDVSTVLGHVLRMPGHALEPLKTWRVWRAVTGMPSEPARALSTDEIRAAARQEHIIRFVSPQVADQLGPQPEALLVLDPQQARVLATLISPAELQNHDTWAVRPRTSPETLLRAVSERANTGTLAFLFSDHRDRLAISFGHTTQVVRVRRNVIVHAAPAPRSSVLARLEGVVLAIEEDAWMPGFVNANRLPALVEQLPERLVQTLLEGSESLRYLESADLRRLARASLYGVGVAGDRRQTLREVPMFELYDEGVPRAGTIAELCLRNTLTIPSFTALPAEPVRVLGLLEPSDEDLTLVRTLSGRAVLPWTRIDSGPTPHARATGESPAPIATNQPPARADTRFAAFRYEDEDLSIELWPAREQPSGAPSLELQLVHQGGALSSLVIESVRFAIVGTIDSKDGLVAGEGALRQRLKSAIEDRLPAFGAHVIGGHFNPFESASAITTLTSLVYQGKLPRTTLVESTHVVLTLMGWVPFRDYARGIVEDSALYELGPVDPVVASALVKLMEALGVHVPEKPTRSAPWSETAWTPPSLTIHTASELEPAASMQEPEVLDVPVNLRFPVPEVAPQARPEPASVRTPPTPFEQLRGLLRQSPGAHVEVFSSAEGPPLRFDRERNALVVNVESPLVVILFERTDVTSLAAAALSAIGSPIVPTELHARWLLDRLGAS